MDRQDGIKQARKILGKNFRLRENSKALREDEKQLVKVRAKELREQRDAIGKQIDERRRAILNADPEYCRLVEELGRLRKAHEGLTASLHSYRVEVGTLDESIAGFPIFHVAANGDNWTEIVRKLTDKKRSG